LNGTYPGGGGKYNRYTIASRAKAVEAGCSRIVTFNKRDFRGSEQFGVQPVTPQEFLREIGVMP
jgi:hypothetical protein